VEAKAASWVVMGGMGCGSSGLEGNVGEGVGDGKPEVGDCCGDNV
jgi:hypothetical protein